MLLRFLLALIIAVHAILAHAEEKLLFEIQYEGLETTIPTKTYGALFAIASDMMKKHEMSSILIESSAYQSYAAPQRRRVVALSRAMAARRILLLKGVDLSKIKIVVGDTEGNENNILKIYEVLK